MTFLYLKPLSGRDAMLSDEAADELEVRPVATRDIGTFTPDLSTRRRHVQAK